MIQGYFIFLIMWVAYWYCPQIAGDWYDAHFNIYQSAISLTLLFLSQGLLDGHWWRKELGCLLALQVFLNLGDAIFDFPIAHYNHIASILNWLEIGIILLCGIPTVYKEHRHGRGANNSGNSSGHSDKTPTRIQKAR